MTAEQASVTLRRTIFAPPAEVYRAWLEPDLLRWWLAPLGFTVTHVEVDERVGGRYWAWGQDESGAIGGFDCELVELIANRRLVFRWRFVGWDGSVQPQPDSRLTVSLRRTSGNATKLSLVHDGLHALAGPGDPREPPARLPELVADGKRSEIWRQYRASGDRALRDRLILTYAPLVKYVAGKLGTWLPPHVEQGDLISYGLLGLIGAIERFEPDRGIKFETYAIPRIRGAMIDELRSIDWVPRSVRNRAREIERAMAELENRHKRTPSDEEVAAELGITLRELEESLNQIARSSVAALDELWAGERREHRADRHDRGSARLGSIARAPRGGDARSARPRDHAPARPRAARGHALLLRRAHPARDRRSPQRHRVACLPAPHQGDPPPPRLVVARRRAPPPGSGSARDPAACEGTSAPERPPRARAARGLRSGDARDGPRRRSRLAVRTRQARGDDRRGGGLSDLAKVEPLLRAGATAVIDTRTPLDGVVDALERIADTVQHRGEAPWLTTRSPQ